MDEQRALRAIIATTYRHGYERGHLVCASDRDFTPDAEAQAYMEDLPAYTEAFLGRVGSLSIEQIAEIGRLIATQDNRATAAPIFAVQERRRYYGVEEGWAEGVVWFRSEGGDAEGAKAARLEAGYRATGTVPEEWNRTGYVDVWEFVTACFTEQGCAEYIRANGHNLTDPRIYAYASYRNHEWQTVRDHLLKAVGNG